MSFACRASRLKLSGKTTVYCAHELRKPSGTHGNWSPSSPSGIRQQLAVPLRALVHRVDLGGKRCQLGTQHGRLHSVQAAVHTHAHVVVLHGALAVHGVAANQLRPPVVVGEHRAAVARSSRGVWRERSWWSICRRTSTRGVRPHRRRSPARRPPAAAGTRPRTPRRSPHSRQAGRINSTATAALGESPAPRAAAHAGAICAGSRLNVPSSTSANTGRRAHGGNHLARREKREIRHDDQRRPAPRPTP